MQAAAVAVSQPSTHNPTIPAPLTSSSFPAVSRLVSENHPQPIPSSDTSSPPPSEPISAVRPANVASNPLPHPSRAYSDASSCVPHWRVAIAAWASAEPSRTDHCNRILDCIEHGLPITPNPLPINKQLPNTPLIAAHAGAVRQQLESHLASGAIERCTRSDITAVHPLHAVVRKDRKLRVVVDFSLNLNDCLVVPPMQHGSSIDTAVRLSQLGCYYSKLDIRDCFHSFSVRGDSQRLLGFCFEGQFYRFKRLPLGLNIAPELCELMLSVVSWQLQQQGVVHVRYCDDLLIIGQSAAACLAMTDTAIATLDFFGFAVSHSKTIRCVQIIEFLGIQFDSANGTLSCPPHRLADLVQLLQSAMQTGTRHVVRFILSLVGKLSFAAHVLPGARPFFRSLIDATRGLHPRAHIVLSPATRDDLAYWLQHLSAWNGRQRWRSSARPIVVATDASLSGWGGLVLYCPPSTTLPPHLSVGSGTAGRWCRSHPIQSSSDIGWAELHAVLYMVAAIGAAAPHSSITLLVDNQSDVAIINRQSTRSPALLSLLRAIYAVATEHNLRLVARHIPGTSNAAADALSRNLPLPSSLRPLRSVSFHCSCDVPPVTVSWCHPWSRYSSGYHCDVPRIRSTSSYSSTTSDSVLIPAVTQRGRSAKHGYAKQPSTSALNVRSTRWVTTSPRSSGGIRQAGSAPSLVAGSTSAYAKVYSMSTLSLTRASLLSPSRLVTSTLPSSISPSYRSRIRETGAHSSSVSLVYFESVSTPLRLPPLSSSGSSTSASSPIALASG